MSEAKKYKCTIITAYDLGYDKWHGTEKGGAIIVAASSPHEARLKILQSDHVNEALSQRPPTWTDPEAVNDPPAYPLKVKQITATALKEAKSLEAMGAPSLFSLSKYDKFKKEERQD